MSHEFSVMVIIVSTILLLAAVCGVLFWGTAQSKQVADMGYTYISDVDHASQKEALQVFEKLQGKSIPTAACYTMLKDNLPIIQKLTCNICYTATAGEEVGDCLKNHLHGRVIISLTEDLSGGTYTATVAAE